MITLDSAQQARQHVGPITVNRPAVREGGGREGGKEGVYYTAQSSHHRRVTADY